MFLSITKGILTASIVVVTLCVLSIFLSGVGLGFFIRPRVQKKARPYVRNFKENSWQRSLINRLLFSNAA